MNVMRMIKLFGWEPKIRQRLAEKREEELKWIWRQNVLDIINDCIKCVFSLCSISMLTRSSYFIPTSVMVVTFGTYVSSNLSPFPTDVLRRR